MPSASPVVLALRSGSENRTAVSAVTSIQRSPSTCSGLPETFTRYSPRGNSTRHGFAQLWIGSFLSVPFATAKIVNFSRGWSPLSSTRNHRSGVVHGIGGSIDGGGNGGGKSGGSEFTGGVAAAGALGSAPSSSPDSGASVHEGSSRGRSPC